MPIQWYPGHMTKARRELAAAMPSKDVIVEVLDARLPRASANPAVTELRGDRPCVKVLSKSDLADPAVTEQWVRHLATPSEGASGAVVALAITTERTGEARARIMELCKRLAPGPRAPGKALQILIAGVPNVGKSTLVNTLVGRSVAIASDKPAVTKMQQHWVLADGTVLHDSPGLMWPKADDVETTLRLALAGSIPDTAIDYLEIATFAANIFLAQCPERLVARFKLGAPPTTAEALLAEIGRRRGCLKGGGEVDLHKASEILVRAFRSGDLGRMSLEVP
jgi:ribosome biogenesis GTPase A